MSRFRSSKGRNLRVASIADIDGGDRRHIGDEAMFLADIAILEENLGPIDLMVCGPHSDAAAARFGAQAIAPFGFEDCSSDQERVALLERVSRQRWPKPNPLRGVDLLLITGGGNLCSSWPTHIFERAALVRVAARNRIPILVLGQMLDPMLSNCHWGVISDMLSLANVVGVRDSSSYDVASAMGVDRHTLFLQPDDAIRLPSSRPELPQGFDDSKPWLSVTVHPFAHLNSEKLTSLGKQLAHWASNHDLQLLFVPHCSIPEGPNGTSDVDIAVNLARLTDGFALCPPYAPFPEPSEAAWVAEHAFAVVSSRYHPLVFATGAAVPALGLPCDDYTLTKINGALDHFGQSEWTLELMAASEGALTSKLECLRRSHGHIRSIIKARQPRIDTMLKIKSEAVYDVVRRVRPG